MKTIPVKGAWLKGTEELSQYVQYEETTPRVDIYVLESKCEYVKIVRTRQFGKEFRSLFREASTLMEKVGQKLEFRDAQIWQESVALQGGWQSIWIKVKKAYVEAREKRRCQQ